MYDIIELSSKSMDELHRIANTLDIKKVESYAKNELICQILDVQAESGAASAASAPKTTNAKTSPVLFDEEVEEAEEEESDEISDIIKDVQEAAMKEIAAEDAKKETIIDKELTETAVVTNEIVKEEDLNEIISSHEEKPEEVVVAEEKPQTKIKTLRPKLIFKQVTEKIIEKEVIVQAPQAPAVEEVAHKPTAKELKQQENDINQIRKIREDIFNLRVNAFNDLKSNKNGVVSEEKQQEVLELEENIREKLKELDSLKQYKITVESEKEQLIKFNQEVKEENSKLVKELEGLESELHTLKSTVGIEEKPYFTKEYYEGYLTDLELQLSDADKELRRNKREFNPLKRIKKTFDQDVVKLRRKEALVAKQKLKIYGVNNVEDIDPDKKKKLEEEVEILTNLKDSVRSCELILKQNKDRYPVLERENALLTKHVETLKKDIETIKKAIAYYEAQEAKQAANASNNEE